MITKSGFKYEISKERLNNYELLEYISEVDTNPLIIPKLLEALLGKKQKQKLIEHVRDKKGLVPTEKLVEEIKEILENKDLKN
jgi:hypothetical protein|nr:MAG TPA: hypothetical protein [Caudoviricetes sp.]